MKIFILIVKIDHKDLMKLPEKIIEIYICNDNVKPNLIDLTQLSKELKKLSIASVSTFDLTNLPPNNYIRFI